MGVEEKSFSKSLKKSKTSISQKTRKHACSWIRLLREEKSSHNQFPCR